jgi:hypothetical protein
MHNTYHRPYPHPLVDQSGLLAPTIVDVCGCAVTLPNSMSRVLPEKTIGRQLVTNSPHFMETRMFITAFTRARQPPLSRFSNIHVNIILPSTPGSFKWPPSFVFSHQTLYAPLHHTCYMSCPPQSSI